MHVGGLAHELRLLLRSPLMTARSRLVMNQVRVRRPNTLKTSGPQPQTKVYIIETNRKIHFIESAGFFKHLPAHEHARACHGGAILLQIRAIEIAGMAS